MTQAVIPAQLTAACRAVSRATPADAVAGVQPDLVARPASTQECSALLREASALGLAVVPRGTGSRLHWGNPPQRCDLVLDLTAMDQVIEHAAGDLVATVQAGITLDQLARVLWQAGQRLALDPPRPGTTRGTVGGVLATGVAGPLRFRYGSGRDLLIGITIVRADGTVAKSGGKVVKNVAGYDLGKLLAGSRGTLGVITQATFRLHPVPARTVIIAATCDSPKRAAKLLAAAADPAIDPVAGEIRWPSAAAPIELAVAIEGDEDTVDDRASALSELLADDSLRRPVCGQVPGLSGPLPLAIPPPPHWWDSEPLAPQDGTLLQVAFWPGDLAGVLGKIRSAAGQAGLDPVVGGSAAAGVLHAGLPGDEDPAAVAAFVTALRAALGHDGQGGTASAAPVPAGRAAPGSGGQAAGPPGRASAVVLHAPPAVGALVDLFGPVSSLALMRSVKQQFDPDRLLSPGRFAGGI